MDLRGVVQVRLPERKNSIRSYAGVYRGVMPAESPCSMGEVEVVISKTQLSIRQATGSAVAEYTCPISWVRLMTHEEVKGEYKAGEEAAEHVTGFMVGTDGIALLFVDRSKPKYRSEPALTVKPQSLPNRLEGSAVLYGPDQVLNGEFDRAINALTAVHGTPVLPLLKCGGKVPEV